MCVCLNTSQEKDADIKQDSSERSNVGCANLRRRERGREIERKRREEEPRNREDAVALGATVSLPSLSHQI